MLTDDLQFWEGVTGTFFFQKMPTVSYRFTLFFGANLTSIDSKLFKEALNCRKI